ncbi:MAG: HAD family hydrolase [bacterium]|nr:HAD family hydrolase [bacterium]
MKKITILRLCFFIHALIFCVSSQAEPIKDPLPSWNEGANKKAILDFVQATTDKKNSQFVPLEQRIATFDQDGTLWVEKPIYVEVIFALDRVIALAPKHPEWKHKEPFKSLISGDKLAISTFTMKQLEEIIMATHTGMTVEAFNLIVKDWIKKAKDPRWNRLYTELVYQPMLEVMNLLRVNGYKIYIVTGGGQNFVRVFADEVYHVSAERVIGSALSTKYGYDKQGKGILIKSPTVLLNDNLSGKPEDIYLFIGRHPQAAFGNSTGDQQMIEYTQAAKGIHLLMLVHHDDAQREYAYGAQSKVGTFSKALMSEATKRGWHVISIKKDWKRVFPFDL